MDKSQQVATPAVAQCQAPTTGVQAVGVSNAEVQAVVGTAMEPWPASGGRRSRTGLDVDPSGLGPDVESALQAIGEAQTCVHEVPAGGPGGALAAPLALAALSGYSLDTEEVMNPACGLDADGDVTRQVLAVVKAAGWKETGQASSTFDVEGGKIQVNMTAYCQRRQDHSMGGSAGGQSTTGTIATTTTTTELGVEVGAAPGGIGAKGTAKASDATSNATTSSQSGGVTASGLPTRHVLADAILAVDIQFFPADELGTPAVETVQGIVGTLEFSEVTW